VPPSGGSGCDLSVEQVAAIPAFMAMDSNASQYSFNISLDSILGK